MTSTDAMTTINDFLAHDDENCSHMLQIRDGLISLDSRDDDDILPLTYELLDALDTEQTTELALSLSLCPIHLIDYAICFDDQDAECEQIRLIHPSHDT